MNDKTKWENAHFEHDAHPVDGPMSKPAAAQERVAWASTGATGQKVVAMPGLHKLPYGDYDLFAAPVAAAPVADTRLANWIIAAVGDIPYSTMTSGQVIDALRTNRHVYEGNEGCGTYYKGDNTPAAPGIDLDALRDIANDLSHSAKVDDYESQQIAFIESIRDRLLTRIDASPKGGHCTTCACDPNMTPAIRFDLSPAMVEGEVRNHLIALGWTPPDSPKGGVNGRATFQRWAVSQNLSTQRSELHIGMGGDYVDRATSRAWEAWQAAMQATSAEVGA